MRAVVLREFGPPERLVAEELPEPTAGPGEVVVAAELAAITFVETQMRSGRVPNPALLPTLPAVLGNGIGGVVASVGAGVDPRLVGRRFVTTTGGSGGYAECAAVAAERLVEVPDRLPLSDALALLADGRTATALMDSAAIETGETVLVEAAAGGVGTLLVQLARDAGATVVAVAGGARKVAMARDLGAAVAVDYRDPGWPARVRGAVGAIDVVFDGVGGEIGAASFELLADGGRFLSYGMASGTMTAVDEAEAARRRVAVRRPAVAGLGEMNELTRRALPDAAAGRLRPVIGQTFPLVEAADAHVAMEARQTIGKTLLARDQTATRVLV
ncbi:MAG TPA: zinc-binding dehydrogenase [Acidimicrobiia bacterium]|nr:zinc-binding dehydrogenase [Acidimicrobiia bacterium]